MKICAIVVTYNRLELLKLTLDKLMKQSHKLDEIIVVNNCCNDGTKEFLEGLGGQITTLNLNDNLGGAGGFYEGLKLAYGKKYDYYWLMDDDTITMENSLDELVKALNILSGRKIGFLCSNVLYKDGKPCIMNIPPIEEEWNELVSESIVKLMGTSFVSVMISREAINEVGLPIKEFFIWGDDAEYTYRISRVFECYMVGRSKVYHYMNSNSGINIITDSPERINRYFFQYRNQLFIARKKGIRYVMRYYISIISTISKILLKGNKDKLKKIGIVLKGVYKGILFNPRIEYLK